MDNLEEMHKFLEKYNLPKLNQEETEIHKHGKQNYNQKSSNKQKDQMSSQMNFTENLQKS